jgi:hypothetical protein
MIGLNNRQNKMKVLSNLPESAKTILVEHQNRNYESARIVNLAPKSTTFNKRSNLNFLDKVESVMGKYIEVEDFDRKAKNAFDSLFSEFSFKK